MVRTNRFFKRLHALIGLFFLVSVSVFAQKTDTLSTHALREVEVRDDRLYNIGRLPAVDGAYLWAGKKNEVIHVQQLDASIADKNPRQIFSKVPGVFVYDMDGSGNQVNIATRGLDPHRGWEYNIRKNGVITNSDLYGYPASHYSMPMEAVDRIQLVRGTGSLQYGSQFGGMINYISKRPDTTRRFAFETINSAGSFGLLSTYQAASGKIGKFQYYVYYNKRVSKGYRDNSETSFDAQAVQLSYAATQNTKFTVELARSNYRYQIPGPLTDSMFHRDPKMSTRARNYFNPEIYVPSISVNSKIGRHTTISWLVSAVLGARNSVQFDKPATTADAIDPLSLQYASRQVDVDHFNSYTTELRLLHDYRLGKFRSVLASGVQLINNNLHRQQLGRGTTGNDFDLTLVAPFVRDLHLKTKNAAAYVENAFYVSEAFVVTPGLRVESGRSVMDGVITSYQTTEVPSAIEHHFLLAGIQMQYSTRHGHQFYTGFTQNYRPVIFKDIIPGSTYEVVADNLKDARGYNLEAGYRGHIHALRWDISCFQLRYNNRLGTLAGESDGAGNVYILRTNIGNSLTNGIEIFAEWEGLRTEKWTVSVFTSSSLMKAQYDHAEVRVGSENRRVDGNDVESTPRVISRNGVTMRYDQLSVSVLGSYTAKSYADALNTETPSASGAVGLVPAYTLLDVNTSFRIMQNLKVRLNVNNILNRQYFTKRPSFYPGPGVWPSDGRSVNVTIALTL